MSVNIVYNTAADDPAARLSDAGLVIACEQYVQPFETAQKKPENGWELPTRYAAGILGGAIVVSEQQIWGDYFNFQSQEIRADKEDLGSAVTALADAFLRAARHGYVATRRTVQNGYTVVDVWKDTPKKGLHVIGSAVFDGDDLRAPYKPRNF